MRGGRDVKSPDRAGRGRLRGVNTGGATADHGQERGGRHALPHGPATALSWDVVVCHVAADAGWARWLSWQLADAGYRALVHPLATSGQDPRGTLGGSAGRDEAGPHRQRALGAQVLVVWSSAAARELAREPDPRIAFPTSLDDPARVDGAPVPVVLLRVQDCARPAALSALPVVDLVDVDAGLARDRALRHISAVAPRPSSSLLPPPFPGLANPPAAVAPAAAAPVTTKATPAPPTPPSERPALGREQQVAALAEERGHAMGVAFSPTAPLVALASTDTTVRLWALPMPDPPRLAATVGYGRRINQEWARAVTFSPDGRLLAAAGDAGTTLLWQLTDPARPQPLVTLTGHRGYLHGVGFSPGGTLLATAGDDRAALLWDVADPAAPRRLAILAGHRGAVRAVTFSPDGTLLATASEDRTVILWDLADPTRPAATVTLSGARGPLHTIAFSPDGDTLAAAGKDRAVRLYSVADPTRPQPVAELGDHRRAVHTVVFSPDGRLFASAGADRVAAVREITDPERPGPAYRLPAHGGPVHALAFAPDSRLLATAGADHVTRLWDLFPAAAAAGGTSGADPG